MTDHEKQIKKLNDMLQAAINQRNASQNECVQLGAHLQEAAREIERLAAEVSALTEKLASDAADDKPDLSTPKANGHAEEMSAA